MLTKELNNSGYENTTIVWPFFYGVPGQSPQGKAPLYVHITVNREKCYIALKQHVELEVWDMGNGKAKGHREKARQINQYLEEVRLSISQHYKALQTESKMITAQLIKRLFLGDPDRSYTLKRLIEYHSQQASGNLVEAWAGRLKA